MLESSAKVGKLDMVKSRQIFKGGQDNPLLAPRGVCLADNHLCVADTAQNRIFIWKKLPQTPTQEPDLVLGQLSKKDTGRNSSGGVSASSLFYPSGIWSDGNRLIVADAWNHRVLIWNTFPNQDGQPADVVLGQPDFDRNEPNVHGISHPPSAQSLNWPYGIFSNGRNLWIADTGNRRVLYFKTIPEENFCAADAVIGKDDFVQRDYEPTGPVWPYSVKVSPGGMLAISDTQYYRVLLWRNWEDAINHPADVIIGQAAFHDNGQNQFGWFPKAHTLNWCYDTCFYHDGIWVADTGNSRLLWYEHVPISNNCAADNVVGQDNFETGSENKNTIWSTEGSLYWPFQVSIEGQTMVVADTGNHRIVINHLHL